MPDIYTTVVGNVAADAEMRFLPSGAAVANFRIGSTPRIKVGESWEDGETIWVKVSCWRDLAEGAANDIRRGVKVIASGKLKQKSYEAKDGSGTRTSLELEADEIGISVRARREKAAATSNAGWGTPAADDSPPF